MTLYNFRNLDYQYKGARTFYKILCLDGGGIRSIFTAKLLFHLHDRYRILDKVDMIAGNSGGSIIAAALACGWSPGQIVDFFAADGPEIFERTEYPGVIDDFAYSTRSKYGDGRLRFFQKYFGERRLSDFKRHICIPAFDTRHRSGIWQPIIYTNFSNSPLKDCTFREAVASSTAAPVYFPVHRTSDEDYTKTVDGGIWANHPGTAALSEAVRVDHGGQRWDRCVMLSLGTTRGKKLLKTSKNDLGWLDWLRSDVIDMITDAGAVMAPDYYQRNFMGARYFRLDRILDSHIDIDAIDRIPELMRLADETDLSWAEEWLQGFWV